ncbi:hypothetical protein, partial [Mesorhizobium sp. M1C.F.Ca.ET.144.01.1.1]|uniref:hypothetical protein n=1 Tax=Mesorhizobium sp. M1C.F.Ca.ET.144.01.1.1 TaxID=2563921 RepID=UPI001AEF0064
MTSDLLPPHNHRRHLSKILFQLIRKPASGADFVGCIVSCWPHLGPGMPAPQREVRMAVSIKVSVYTNGDDAFV